MKLFSEKTEYHPLHQQLADAHSSDIESDRDYPRKSKRSRGAWLYYSFCFFLVGVIGGFAFSSYFGFDREISRPLKSTSCSDPPVRREWRSLSSTEKHDYINAVKCLTQTPSKLGLNQSLHDDFPWVHYRIGEDSHHAAGFLAWHRSFINTYENTLRNECGYKGHLTYWDWSLDWQDITAAPVWHETEGFGGNGNNNISQEVLEGFCVDNGPFANLQIHYIDSDYKPHCLSRGFLKGEKLHEYGTWFNPEAIEKLMAHENYDDFNLGLEDAAHNAIPRSIRGDFSMLTAPSDPVFFLHHTQLDRLWWTWQHRDPPNRMWQYNGAAAHGSKEAASLDDKIRLGALDKEVSVHEIILTEGDMLCYRY